MNFYIKLKHFTKKKTEINFKIFHFIRIKDWNCMQKWNGRFMTLPDEKLCLCVRSSHTHTHTHTHRRNGRKYLNFIWPWPNRIHLSRQRTWQWVMAPLFIWKIFVRALWQGPKSSDRHLFYGHSHKGEIYLCGPLSARYAENARLFHFFFFTHF